MAGPLSAFAARRVAPKPQPHKGTREDPNMAPAVLPDDTENLDLEQIPRKRRRTDKKVKTSNTIEIMPADVRDQAEEFKSPALSEASHISDGSSEGQESGSELEISSRSKILVRKLSTFVPSTENILCDTDKEWTVRLHSRETLVIVGQYDLWVRKGAVGVLGAVLHAGSTLHRIYAPTTHAIPSIRPIRNPYGWKDQHVELTVISCGSGIRMLKRIASKFGRIWNGNPNKEANAPENHLPRRSFLNLQLSVDDIHQRPLSELKPPMDWQTMISRLMPGSPASHALKSSGDWQTAYSKLAPRNPPRQTTAVLVCGPKGSGKSSFSRMLVNAILSKPNKESQSSDQMAALLDLDPGQPEFSPPGEVSLTEMRSCDFGVPFAHPVVPPLNGSQTMRAHHIGNVSRKDDPHHYLACALDLFYAYEVLLQSNPACPLIINCPGWIQGRGLEILSDLIYNLTLTDVIYMSIAGPEEVTDTLAHACSVKKTAFHQLNSQPFLTATRAASELRMMQTLSYFHLDESEAGNVRWNPKPLAEMAPLIVPYAGPKQGIFAVMMLGDKQNPEFFDCILEGCLVSITVLDDNSAIPFAEDANSMDGAESSGVDMNPALPFEVQTQSPRQLVSNGEESYTDQQSYENSKTTIQGQLQSEAVQNIPTHLSHPSILRSPIGLPYLSTTSHTTPPLPPSKSHSLGLALIRSIDPTTRALHLLTPIPASTLQHLHQQKHKLVLVRGQLDSPTWAYREQIELQKRRGEDVDIKGWVERTPWAEAVEGGRGGSARVKRTRRDLRYRSQA